MNARCGPKAKPWIRRRNALGGAPTRTIDAQAKPE
jgi:hypothetical protein